MTLDATEISRVVKDGDLIAMAVLGGLAAAPLVKGLFALIATRRQRRKEFLEFWKADSLESSNLWLEEAIQHRYGASIPAELIRHVARLSWPSKRLRRLAMSAEFLQMDETGQAVTWSKKRRANAFWLEVEMVMSVGGYVALAALGVALIITGSRQGLGEAHDFGVRRDPRQFGLRRLHALHISYRGTVLSGRHQRRTSQGALVSRQRKAERLTLEKFRPPSIYRDASRRSRNEIPCPRILGAKWTSDWAQSCL
ncbi:hypothetical protein [Stenotrophomonas sp. TEPEL]|uniref:hypothetical protein n=1 Tax=Stenotrophomonas sp. TEPEL TaxID=2283801 RepID=UPI00104C5717|nr:hypothetical protein [Stenotrophomonas sp. TEPEL]